MIPLSDTSAVMDTGTIASSAAALGAAVLSGVGTRVRAEVGVEVALAEVGVEVALVLFVPLVGEVG